MNNNKEIKQQAAIAGQGITEECSLEKTVDIAEAVYTAIGEVIDEYIKKGNLGIMETLLGSSMGYARFLCTFSAIHEPKLNPDMLIRTAIISMESYDTKKDMDDIDAAMDAIYADWESMEGKE